MYNKSGLPSKTQISWATKIYNKTKIPLPKEQTYEAFYEYISINNKKYNEIKELESTADRGYNFKNNGKSQAKVELFLNYFPKNCGECTFYLNSQYYDEDSFFGDGEVHFCPFGGDNYGCMIERQKNCPLIKI